MIRILFTLFTALFALLSVVSYADETKLLDITNNHYEDERAEVNLVLSPGGAIWGLHYMQVNDDNKRDRFITLERMKSENPALRTESIFNVTVTRVHADPNFSPTTGGAFQLELLQGLGNFRVLHLELDKIAGRWTVFVNEKDGKHDVTRAYLSTRATGINSITLYDSQGRSHLYVLGRDL